MATRLGCLILAVVITGPRSAAANTAQDLLDAAGVEGGLVVHVNCGDARLTAGLGAGDSYLVQGLDHLPSNVQAARRYLRSAGAVGKVTVSRWEGTHLPYVDNLVNLLVISQESSSAAGGNTGLTADEALRVLAPGGVALVAKGLELQGLDSAAKTSAAVVAKLPNGWMKIVKGVPAETDEWTHYLHGPDNNAVSHDQWVAPPSHMQFRTDPEWSRNHHKLASLSALVTAKGRLFYIMDSGPDAKMEVPPRWWVVARGAYNGVYLWKRPITTWTDPLRGFRSGPAQLPRLLVTNGDRVFVPLSYDKPVVALDAASGDTALSYSGSEGAEELVLSGDRLLVVTGTPVPTQALKLSGITGRTETKRLLAYEVGSGKQLWQSEPMRPGELFVCTLGADRQQVYYQYGSNVVCRDLDTGAARWSTDLAAHGTSPRRRSGNQGPSEGKKRNKNRKTKSAGGRSQQASVGTSTLVVCGDTLVISDGRSVQALATKDGSVRWATKGTPGFKSPQDVLVIDGTVWLGKEFTDGYDLKTGEVKAHGIMDRVQTAGHHHRCYRDKATDRYILGSHRGIEFMDLAGDDNARCNWVRGTCQYGIMPANGLTYAPPHSCGCYMEAKLYGFWALSARRADWQLDDQGGRLEKGPAFGQASSKATGASENRTQSSQDWPTFRMDARRSGATSTALGDALARQWNAQIGSELTAPVIAEGSVLVADIPSHTVKAIEARNGRLRWTFVADAEVDSPPTVWKHLALFGCRDGWVYCLRMSDGQLVWRFRAAPKDLRTVDRDRVESLWPVYGSVLVQDDLAYFCAGRNTYLDGGLFLYAVRPATGEVVYHRQYSSPRPKIYSNEEAQQLAAKFPRQVISQNTVDYRTFVAADHSDGFSMAGNMNDIVTGDGAHVFLRHQSFTRDWQPSREKYPHLFSTSHFTDGNENHRSHMAIGLGYFGRTVYAYPWIPQRFGRQLNFPVGLMFTYEGSQAWGIQRGSEYIYTLFQKSIPAMRADDPAYKNDLIRTGGKWAWSTKPGMRPRAIIKAGDKIYLGGMPTLDPRDPYATFEGREGGVIAVFDAANGQRHPDIRLKSPVVWHGMAAAQGQLFASLADGSITCLAASGQ